MCFYFILNLPPLLMCFYFILNLPPLRRCFYFGNVVTKAIGKILII